MKYYLILILSLSFSIAATAQDSLGFTNKAEAENKTVNGLKEGKWVEYVDNNLAITTDNTAPQYRLTVYKAGEIYGIVRQYLKNGKLLQEVPYRGGKVNGMVNRFYENGRMEEETPYTNNVRNGVQKDYYDNGKLSAEIPFTADKINGVFKSYYYNTGKLWHEINYSDNQLNGADKSYYENGKLESETTFTYNKKVESKNYDENGNVIK
jgi:antitoxin component YwqK of YwqJK toxin-antitoxin module